jgi:hypothetical protein
LRSIPARTSPSPISIPPRWLTSRPAIWAATPERRYASWTPLQSAPLFAQSFHHLPPSLASWVFAEGTRVADKLLIIDLPRPPSIPHLATLAAFLPLTVVHPFAHEARLVSLRAYSSSAMRALARYADPSIQLRIHKQQLWGRQIVVANRPG